jgi:hypothetical protein
MKKMWLAIATGILGVVFGSSLVWSQPHAQVELQPDLADTRPAAL